MVLARRLERGGRLGIAALGLGEAGGVAGFALGEVVFFSAVVTLRRWLEGVGDAEGEVRGAIWKKMGKESGRPDDGGGAGPMSDGEEVMSELEDE